MWFRVEGLGQKKQQKRFLVPRLLGITYVSTSGRPHEAVGICARNRPKYLNASRSF